MRWRLGTMTFGLADWAGTFYPERLPKARWLGHYASRFDAIELNSTFHAVPAAETVAKWLEQVESGFRFAVKAPRSVTHDGPTVAGTVLPEFFDIVREFGDAIGPVLFQFPQEVTYSQFAAVRALLSEVPREFRVAVEFRSASWFRGEVYELLRGQNVALVAAELEGHPESAGIVPTADFLYVRLLGRHGRFPDAKTERFDATPRLIDWHRRILAAAERCGAGECWVFFNDDYAGHAPATLRRFAGVAKVSLPEEPVKQRKLF